MKKRLLLGNPLRPWTPWIIRPDRLPVNTPALIAG